MSHIFVAYCNPVVMRNHELLGLLDEYDALTEPNLLYGGMTIYCLRNQGKNLLVLRQYS